MSTAQDRLLEQIRQKVEILNGDRGNNAAARMADLKPIGARLSALEAQVSKQAGSVNIAVPTLTSAHAAGGTPTAAEFNKLVDDMKAMRQALATIAAAM